MTIKTYVEGSDLKTCPKCKGKGEIVKIDPLLALCSFGMSALIEISTPYHCGTCDGHGVIRIVRGAK